MSDFLNVYVSDDKDKVKIVSSNNRGIVDYVIEKKDDDFSIGDIILGVVKKKTLVINSFFIKLNSPIDGFMHFSDLTDRSLTLNSFCNDLINGKKVKVTTYNVDERENRASFDYNYTADYINDGDYILTQVIKKPIFNKGPRLSSRITLAGDFVILVIFNNEIKLSKKIKDSVKHNKMISIINEIKTELKLNNFGIILRTSAELFIDFDKPDEAKKILLDDILSLLKIWSKCIEKIKVAKVGTKIFSPNNAVLKIIQDKLKDNIKNIYVDNVNIYNDLKNYLKTLIKDSCNIKLYVNESLPLFSYKGINKQLKTLFNKKVMFSDGCYLLIETTEAMNVIDVNSGSLLDNFTDQEDLSLSVNLLAAEEIARQLILRDMGGLISIDFIDMKLQKNRMLLYEKMKELLHEDKSNTTVLPLSRFNIMQITRQRIRPIIQIDDKEKCPTCDGKGTLVSVINVVQAVEGEIRLFLKTTKFYRIDIYLNPILVPYFSIGLFSKRFVWSFKYFKSIKLHEDDSLPLNIVKIFNKKKLIKEINV